MVSTLRGIRSQSNKILAKVLENSEPDCHNQVLVYSEYNVQERVGTCRQPNVGPGRFRIWNGGARMKVHISVLRICDRLVD